jgi:DNA helicase-2/ATP-dependent DNA helicase PcrA
VHQEFRENAPTPEDAERLARESFHLKHVFPSRDPENNPGAYERARDSAARIVTDYVRNFGDDFSRNRQVEQRFEIPADGCVVTGSIDLLLRQGDDGQALQAEVVDFKSMNANPDLNPGNQVDWAEMSLQVQLYAKAAREVVGEDVQVGAVHLLRSGERVQVPVSEEAVAGALGTIEWAVGRIAERDFPMRGTLEKCAQCDFGRICAKRREDFATPAEPPEIHVPGGSRRKIRAFE